jgi:mannose-binding lectin
VNLPLPYATGNDYPGGNVGITVDGTLASVTGGFTYNEQVPPSTGRVPTTLVVSVPLTLTQQKIVAVWSGVRGSTVIIDTPATMSALF